MATLPPPRRRRKKCPTPLKKRFPDKAAADLYAAVTNNGTGWTRNRSGDSQRSNRRFGQMGGSGAERFVVAYPCRCEGWHVKSVKRKKERE